jgi:hypothetical protein
MVGTLLSERPPFRGDARASRSLLYDIHDLVHDYLHARTHVAQH